MPERALTLFTFMWRIGLSRVCGSGIVMTSKSRSRTEYLIPTDNILMFDWYFNLTNKSNLISTFWYALIRYFDNLVVAYFFGPPCTQRLYLRFAWLQCIDRSPPTDIDCRSSPTVIMIMTCFASFLFSIMWLFCTAVLMHQLRINIFVVLVVVVIGPMSSLRSFRLFFTGRRLPRWSRRCSAMQKGAIRWISSRGPTPHPSAFAGRAVSVSGSHSFILLGLVYLNTE